MNGDNQCQGFIPDIYRILAKYGLTDTVFSFLRDAQFLSKVSWSSVVKQRVTEAAKRELISDQRLASLAPVYPLLFNLNKPICFWTLLQKNPNLRSFCICAMQVLAKLVANSFSVRCNKCFTCTDNFVCHIIFHCVKNDKHRRNLWHKVCNTYGSHVFQTHIISSKEVQVFDILSGFHRYSEELSEKIHTFFV